MEPNPLDRERALPGRRAFFRRLLQALAGLWGAGGALGLFFYLRAPRRRGEGGGSAVQVGSLDELPPGQGRLVTGRHRPFWVIHRADGELVALPAVCTHRHCILEWDNGQQLICPCHQGRFDLNGNVLGGPPPRHLEPLPVMVKGGVIYVRA